MTETPAVDWSELMSSWDRQQEGHLPAREERFNAMFDAIEVLVGEKFLALDLACGPGSISQRLLDRFPSARSVAVDVDPLLLALGRGALGTVDDRLRWAERNLRDPAWTAGLTETAEPFDAVLSTTAQHWFKPPQLAVLYRQLATIVRPGGIVLIGDYMPYDESQPSLARLARTIEQREEKRAFQREGVLDWWQWWDHLSEIPALAELLAERERRFADPKHVDPTGALWKGPTVFRPSRRFADAALTEAGFQEVGSIWQSSRTTSCSPSDSRSRAPCTLSDLRKDHRNSHQRWTPEEDARLAQRAREESMAEHGRNQGAIIARLERIRLTEPDA